MKPTPAQERFLRSLLEKSVITDFNMSSAFASSGCHKKCEKHGWVSSKHCTRGEWETTITDLGRKAIGIQ